MKKEKKKTIKFRWNQFLINPFVTTGERRCYACVQRITPGINSSGTWGLCRDCDWLHLEIKNFYWPSHRPKQASLRRLRDYWLAS